MLNGYKIISQILHFENITIEVVGSKFAKATAIRYFWLSGETKIIYNKPINNAKIMQKFGDAVADQNAYEIIQNQFPDRTIEQIT